MNNGQKARVSRNHVLVILLLVSLIQMAPVTGSAQDGSSRRAPAADRVLSKLTAEEQVWLRDHPVISLAHDPGWPPIEFTNEHGELSGMSGDYLRLVEERLGVKFERVRNLTWQETYARQKRWDIDVATCVAVTSPRLEFWAFTKPYLSIPIVIATQANVTYLADMKELVGKKVALVEGYAIDDWVTKDFAEINLVRVKDPLEGLALLQRGEVFAYIDNQLIIGDYLAKMRINTLKIAGQTPYVNAQCMAVRRDWAPLAGILDKALDSISAKEREDIYRKWLPVRYEHGFNYTLLWQALGVFAAILLVLAYWNRKLAKEIRNRKQADAALRDSQKKYQQLIETTDTGYVIIDHQGRVTDANQEYLRLTGRQRREEILGHSVQEWTAAHDHARNEAAIRSCAEQGFVRNLEIGYVAPSGQVTPVEINATVLGHGASLQILNLCRDITERKRAEDALRESEETFRKLYEDSPDPILLMQGNRFIRCNSATLRFLGIADERRFLGSDPMDISPERQPDGRLSAEAAPEYIARAHAEGFCRFEWLCKTYADVPFLLEVTLMPITLRGEKLLHITWRDITARQRAEAALQEKTEELDRFFTTTLDLLCVADTDGCFRLLNPQWEAVLGYPLTELQGRRFLDLVHPEDLEATVQAVARLDAQQPVLNFVNRYRCKDGSYRWFEWRSSPRGKLIYAAARDITERKLVEEALRESEKKYQSLFGNAQVALFRTGISDGKLLEINDRYAQMAGYSNVDDCVAEFNAADAWTDPNARIDLRRILAEKGFVTDYEAEIVRRDGNHIWILFSATIFPEQGFIEGSIVDITERKQAETALQSSLAEKDSLLKEVHHRVKNNLQVISSLLSLQFRQVENAEVRSFLRDTQNRIRSMAMLHEILYHSENKAKINFPQYVKDLCAQVARSLGSKARKIRLRQEIAPVALNLDQAVTAGLILNELLTNAFKHAFPSRSEGEILVELQVPDEHHLLLRVSDDGIGFFPESPPQRSESLGLLLVKNLSRQLDGHLSVTGHAGTVFEIIFPLNPLEM